MAGTNDLSPILSRSEPGRVEWGQGILTSWNPETFANTIKWQEVSLSSAIIAPGVDALSLQQGDPVLLLILKPPEGGTPSFVVLGRMSVPPLAEPVAIRGGDLVVTGGGDVTVDDGGNFEALDGSHIHGRYPDESSAVSWGTLIDSSTEDRIGHGILIQDDETGDKADIFSAYRRSADGEKFVVAGIVQGGTPYPLALFDIRSDQIQIVSYDSGAISTFILQDISILLQSENQINLRTPNTPAVRVDAASTGDSANAVILSPNGTIAVSTSARRFKTAIEDYQADTDAVLQLRARTWRDKRDVELAPDTDRWHVGLVSDEVDALGLTEYVDYDEDGEPQRVTYDRLCIALLQIVQSQEERLAALEATVGITAPKQTRPVTRKPKRRPIDDGPDDDVRGTDR